jgi:hypothetical protein
MDYFILKDKSGNHWCANNVVRQKDSEGKDIVSFTCSGRLTVLPADQVLAIATSTPPHDWK